jgi:hypothetical protein
MVGKSSVRSMRLYFGNVLMTKIRVNRNDFLVFISGSRSVPGTNLTQLGFYQKVIKSYVLSTSRAFGGGG